jgi:thiol-disulfide isomerase/thioredoxin
MREATQSIGRLVLLASCLAVTATTAAAADAPAKAEVTLKVGDPAPAMDVAKWVKGEPVAKFEAGKVYIVEFWATWCGPCKVSIPHLTELAKKLEGKAMVIGISIWESKDAADDAHLEKVADFVQKMGAKMDYVIGADGKAGAVAKAWMEAAGQSGIPTAFIVGKDGRIAWIGSPMANLDEAVEQVIAGTFDRNAEAGRQERLAEEKRKQQELYAPLAAARKSGDAKAIVAEVDKLVAVRPDQEPRLYTTRFEALLQSDEPAAFAYVKTLVEKGAFKSQPMAAYSIGRSVLDNPSRLKTPDFPVMVEMMQQAAEASGQKNQDIVCCYAEALFRVGKIQAAIDTMQKAIELAQAKLADGYPQGSVDYMKRRLAAFEKAKAK